MKLDESKKILIVGLGLLGGSYAQSLTRQGYYVTAITRKQSTIDYALEHNMITKGSAFVDPELIKEADIIIFALYPHIFVDWIKQYGSLIQPKTVITDVTGVKQCIVYEIQSMLPQGVEFISAHPMAGKETAGIEYADESIFKNANYIVVPTENNSLDTVELCGDLGETLGFREISVLSPEKHDRMIAFLSQLTHCIAVSLMCACDEPDLERYTGDSFRDLTRIANINDEMWSELFLSNRETLLDEMDKYRESFDKLYNTIKNGDRDEMREMMRLSTARRRKFNKEKK
ncbi:MAG: prephenate dehydrogenase [Ruminococcaceae bacterium]|nr:prephenate dehydrogenase [Oscillospiraceae bacterium]